MLKDFESFHALLNNKTIKVLDKSGAHGHEVSISKKIYK